MEPLNLVAVAVLTAAGPQLDKEVVILRFGLLPLVEHGLHCRVTQHHTNWDATIGVRFGHWAAIAAAAGGLSGIHFGRATAFFALFGLGISR